MRRAASLVRLAIFAGVPLALGFSLAWRVTRAAQRRAAIPVPAVAPGTAPAARVPEAPPVDVDALPMPRCWTGGCPRVQGGEVDLDLLAPLGDGPGNAATWLASFSKEEPRMRDGVDARARRVPAMLGDEPGRVLPPGDALLAEAEPWVDQATCRFYPEVFELDAEGLRKPNLLLALTLAKSWAARSDESGSLEDARRAIRLGRLLLQDDTSIAQDLAGRACIRVGLDALHRRARHDGDLALALATSLALSDVDGARFEAGRSAAVLQSVVPAALGALGGEHVLVSDADLAALVALAHGGADRRSRIGALEPLRLVADGGTSAQREVARDALTSLDGDADSLVASAARSVSLVRERGE